MFIFGLVLTALVTTLHAYVFWRAASVPFLASRVSRRGWLAAAGGLWLAFVLGRVGHGAVPLLGVVSVYWLAIVFLLAACLLIADASTGFGRLLPRRAGQIRGWALAAGAALCVIALVQGRRAPALRELDVTLAGLPKALDGTKVAVLSDLHLGSTLGAPWMRERAAEVAALRPDLVVLLGDILEGRRPPAPDVVAALKSLSAPLGVWAVTGNHETYGRSFSPELRAAGFQVLEDRWTELRPGLVLAGVGYSRSGGEGKIERALRSRPPGGSVLLSHMPVHAAAAARAGAGLMLCGHTHGGQIWPFGEVVRHRFPLFAGEYKVGAMTVLVSRGTGLWGPRMRLWHRGEIWLLRLRAP